jgi:rubrerythrin
MTEIDATLAALQMAMQTEIDGHSFYQRCAVATEDENARRMFARLAQDEVMHLELLRSTMAMLQEGGEWAVYQGMTWDELGGAPIFSRERVRQNLTAYTSDLSALRVAYLIEKDAVNFSRRSRSRTTQRPAHVLRPGEDGDGPSGNIGGGVRLLERPIPARHGVCPVLGRRKKRRLCYSSAINSA